MCINLMSSIPHFSYHSHLNQLHSDVFMPAFIKTPLVNGTDDLQKPFKVSFLTLQKALSSLSLFSLHLISCYHTLLLSQYRTVSSWFLWLALISLNSKYRVVIGSFFYFLLPLIFFINIQSLVDSADCQKYKEHFSIVDFYSFVQTFPQDFRFEYLFSIYT